MLSLMHKISHGNGPIHQDIQKKTNNITFFFELISFIETSPIIEEIKNDFKKL